MTFQPCDKNKLKWQKPSQGMDRLVHVPSTNTEETGFMTCTAASHQGAIKRSRHVVHSELHSSMFLH